MEEDTGKEAFVRNEYPTEKLHEDFKQLMQDELMKVILENKEKKREIETLEIIKRGKETLELWNEIKSYVEKNSDVKVQIVN